MPAANAFIARLRALTTLGEHDIAALAALASEERAEPGDRQLIEEGDEPERLHILLEGWAARVKWLPDGRRHFPALLLPGDLCDVDGLHVRFYDYGVLALTPCVVATIDRAALLALCERSPAVARALAWFTFVDNALLNEAAVSLARRSASERMAHLLCELMLRLEAVGRAGGRGYELPLTQEKIADLLGLTGVHVNRVTRRLRTDGLAEIRERRLTVPDWGALRRAAGFSPDYLHLDGMRRS